MFSNIQSKKKWKRGIQKARVQPSSLMMLQKAKAEMQKEMKEVCVAWRQQGTWTEVRRPADSGQVHTPAASAPSPAKLGGQVKPFGWSLPDYQAVVTIKTGCLI